MGLSAVSVNKCFIDNTNVMALPPEVQKQREIDAIKKDPRLVELIGNSVYEIRETETGYMIVTDWCEVSVTINYLPREDGLVGPAEFEVLFEGFDSH